MDITQFFVQKNVNINQCIIQSGSVVLPYLDKNNTINLIKHFGNDYFFLLLPDKYYFILIFSICIQCIL